MEKEDNNVKSKHVEEMKTDTDSKETDTRQEKRTEEINNNNSRHVKEKHTNIFIVICIAGVCLGLTLEIAKVQNWRFKSNEDETSKPGKKYWVFSTESDVDNPNGLLKHVHLVLERMGFQKSTNSTPWDLLWSHDYPFRVLYPNMYRLKPHQRVNHFPGIGFVTNKVDLATSESKYIPKAFKLPLNKQEFLDYAEAHPKALFLEKHNQHRGVFLKNVTEIDVSSGESFVQEFMQRPFLVDGHKFDIGVYVGLTSVNPLRAYWYKGDVLFRYCPAKYYPFDPSNVDKYVIADDYRPTWEVPSLAKPYTALGYSMKDAFDIYVRSQGKDPSKIWDEVHNAIAEILLMKEHHIIESLKNYQAPENFFELMRFDLVVDEDLKVFLLEANMSPNLSSAHYPPNQLLYEQVLYNLLTLTGVGSPVTDFREQSPSQTMISSEKNIAVYGQECSTSCQDRCEGDPVCGLCRPCVGPQLRRSLLRAHKEHLHRGDFRRLVPPSMKPGKIDDDFLKGLSESNKLHHLWYQGKCNIDPTYCS